MAESSPKSPRKTKQLKSSFNTVASSLQPVDPVQPIAPYIGGKKNLFKRLTAMIDTVEHKAYAEPFVGMGGVFFRRRFRPKAEFINDWSTDVANLFRICQRHYIPFMDMMRFELTTRTGFDRLLKTDPKTLTDLERAARFLYLQKTGFGGMVSGRNFGTSYDRPARFDITKLAPMLEDVHERLSRVTIERLNWMDFINKYDRAGMLFYCDPPYFGNENDYGNDDAGKPLFDRDQFEQMAALFGAMKGRFILSINDRPEIRKVFARFSFETVDVTYTIGGGNNAGKFGELIIHNLD